MGLALPASTLLDERREAGKSRRLFSVDLTQLRRAQGDGGALADPRHTEHEREAPGQVGMALKGGNQAPQFVGAARLQVLDVCRYHRAQARIADVSEACLQAGDVRFDLFDEGQLLADRRGSAAFVSLGSRTSVQAAIRTASMRSLLARRRCSFAKARTCSGCKTTSVKPAACRCRATPRSYV
jgi:hypothetical protein